MNAQQKPSAADLRILLSFLNDSNASTVELTKTQLRGLLLRYPELHDEIGQHAAPEVAPIAHAFLEKERLDALLQAFEKLAAQGDELDLEFGSFLLASFAHPKLTLGEIQGPLEELGRSLGNRIDAADTDDVREIAGLTSDLLFEEWAFQGNERNYYDPDNSYLDSVLERRLGIPISLSVVFLLVGWRAEFPVYGVGLPGHFIVGFDTPKGAMFLDPFYQGRPLTREDCIELVRQRGVRFEDAFLMPASPRQILQRMIVNLVNIYTEKGDREQAHWLTQFSQLLGA